MKKVTAQMLKETLSDYIFSEVPTGDFESADDLKAALMDTLEAMVNMVVDEEFDFEDEDEDAE